MANSGTTSGISNAIQGQTQPGRITVAGTCDTTGEICRISGMDAVKSFRAQLQSGAVAGTNPTLDVKVQDSVDGGQNWNDLASFSFAQITGASQVKAMKEFTGLHGPLLRLHGTIGGTVGPSVAFTLDMWVGF